MFTYISKRSVLFAIVFCALGLTSSMQVYAMEREESKRPNAHQALLDSAAKRKRTRQKPIDIGVARSGDQKDSLMLPFVSGDILPTNLLGFHIKQVNKRNPEQYADILVWIDIPTVLTLLKVNRKLLQQFRTVIPTIIQKLRQLSPTNFDRISGYTDVDQLRRYRLGRLMGDCTRNKNFVNADLLMQAGANPENLRIAFETCQTYTAQDLISFLRWVRKHQAPAVLYNVNTSLETATTWTTPLHILCRRAAQDPALVPAVMLFIDTAAADPDIQLRMVSHRDYKGDNVLHAYTSTLREIRGGDPIIQRLILAGADSNAQNYERRGALQTEKEYREERSIRILKYFAIAYCVLLMMNYTIHAAL